MPKTTFLVLKSPQELDPNHVIKRLVDKQDTTVILVEDGIYQATMTKPAERLAESAHEVLVSHEDLEARGFTSSDLKVGRTTDYAGIIDSIMERTERTITI